MLALSHAGFRSRRHLPRPGLRTIPLSPTLSPTFKPCNFQPFQQFLSAPSPTPAHAPSSLPIALFRFPNPMHGSGHAGTATTLFCSWASAHFPTRKGCTLSPGTQALASFSAASPLHTRHSSLSPLEATLTKLQQNKQLYLSLESTLMRNTGGRPGYG